MAKLLVAASLFYASMGRMSDNSEAEIDPESYTLGYNTSDTEGALSSARKLSHKSLLFTTISTKKCAEDCIDKGAHFCPTDTYAGNGMCCIDYSCSRKRTDFCSYHTPNKSSNLKLWSCPYDRTTCGPLPRFIIKPGKKEKGKF